MSLTERSAANISAMVQEVWSPIFMKQLREKLLLSGVVIRDYEGEMKMLGDTVKVSQISAPAGELLTVGTDADSFSPEALTSQTIDLIADRRAVASYEFEDLVMLQTQLGQKDSEIRDALMFAAMKQLNDQLYSLVAPSATNIVTGATLTASVLASIRKIAGVEKWDRSKQWWGFVSPGYQEDLNVATQLVSSDFIPTDGATETGSFVRDRFNFKIIEDDSRTGDTALFFHPDWLLLAMQTTPTFKVSDLHSNKKFGNVISVDFVFGARLGIDGADKHITLNPE